MKILLHCPIASDATSFYRGFGPFNELAKKADVEIINGSNSFEVNWHTLQNIDLVFLQRPSSPICVQIMKLCKQYKKPTWIDYDDDYIRIPETNPRHDMYTNTTRQVHIRECVAMADLITVSTEAIKNSLTKELNPEAEIHVIPNACDYNLFHPAAAPNNTKTVLWRGGDTHASDVEFYKDAILKCFDAFPDYKWVFYGHKFKWLIEHALAKGDGSHKRISTYDFLGVLEYFTNLMQTRPEIMIVPLESNDFNRAKSNISWIEGTMAGATIMAKALPEFVNSHGCAVFDTHEEFIETFSTLVKSRKIREELYQESIANIPDLKDANKKRLELASSLVFHNASNKFSPVVVEEKQWESRRFFEYILLNGYIQDNENYQKGHHNVADWLNEKLKPESMIEFGCGPGPILERFLMNNVESIGLEINDYLIDYFQTRNPVFADRIVKCDFAVKNLDDLVIDKTDLGISIEVFEHIDMSEKWWNDFIAKLAANIKYFYFSSTPNCASVKFDQQWGHINLRQTEAWIDLFTRNGWKLMENPNKVCAWDLLFESDPNQANLKPPFKKFNPKKLTIGKKKKR